MKWGLPWPEDPEHVVYVWYDALTSYLSGIGYGDDERCSTRNTGRRNCTWWARRLSGFTAVYWPAFLWAAGEQLPKGVFAHGWLLFDQQKMSMTIRVDYPAGGPKQ